MKAGKAVGAMVPYVLIVVGLAVMYQVAQRSGLLEGLGGAFGAIGGLGGGGRSSGGAGAGSAAAGGSAGVAGTTGTGTGTGGLASVVGAAQTGAGTGAATTGKGTAVNSSPLVNATVVGSFGPALALVPGVKFDQVTPDKARVSVPKFKKIAGGYEVPKSLGGGRVASGNKVGAFADTKTGELYATPGPNRVPLFA